MKTVRLSLRNEDDSVAADVEGTFSEEDLSLLRQYARHMERVRATALIQRGMPFISNIEWHVGAPVTFTCPEYTNPELHELLHVLRPLILESEQASFHKVVGLLGRRFQDKTFAAQQKYFRRMFEDGELSMFMQVSLGGQPLLDDSLLRMWLNGTQYHTDADKAAAWEKLEAALTTDNARAIVISQLHSRAKALFLLEHTVNLIVGSNSPPAVS